MYAASMAIPGKTRGCLGFHMLAAEAPGRALLRHMSFLCRSVLEQTPARELGGCVLLIAFILSTVPEPRGLSHLPLDATLL